MFLVTFDKQCLHEEFEQMFSEEGGSRLQFLKILSVTVFMYLIFCL